MTSPSASQTCTHSGGMENMPSTMSPTPTWTTIIKSVSDPSSSTESATTADTLLQPRWATYTNGVLDVYPDYPTTTPSLPATTVTATATPAASPSSGSGGLSGAVIAVIVISIVLGLLTTFLTIRCCCRRSGRKGSAKQRASGRDARARARRARARGGTFEPVYVSEPQQVYFRR